MSHKKKASSKILKDSSKTVSAEERDLFRDAVGEVKPVATDKQQLVRKKPPAIPRSRERDERSVMEELLSDFSENDLLETGEHLSWTCPGVQRSVLKNLKSGKYARQATLDLHGFTKEESRIVMRQFLHDVVEDQLTCVSIIHGKGRKHSGMPPVLKPAVATWLSRHKHILAFCSAREVDGGTGAVYVLLRKKRRT